MKKNTLGSMHFRNNPKGARGFLRASDTDRDDRVSRAEYVRNRIITDEAKDIYRKIAPGKDWGRIPVFQWSIAKEAFLSSHYLDNSTLAMRIFEVMDQIVDGRLSLPEFLMTYGLWARQAMPAELLDGNK